MKKLRSKRSFLKKDFSPKIPKTNSEVSFDQNENKTSGIGQIKK